jgi:hypothetical protein
VDIPGVITVAIAISIEPFKEGENTPQRGDFASLRLAIVVTNLEIGEAHTSYAPRNPAGRFVTELLIPRSKSFDGRSQVNATSTSTTVTHGHT